jgi:hypothetical protein
MMSRNQQRAVHLMSRLKSTATDHIDRPIQQRKPSLPDVGKRPVADQKDDPRHQNTGVSHPTDAFRYHYYDEMIARRQDPIAVLLG